MVKRDEHEIRKENETEEDRNWNIDCVADQDMPIIIYTIFPLIAFATASDFECT